MDKQICALCGKIHIVPEKHQVNHCTVIIHHHYGSPKDGDTYTYDVCVDCIEKLFNKKKPTKVESSW